MGNRAVITFSTASSAPCIYLHWNGGRASVEAFLLAARHLNLHAPVSGMSSGHDYRDQARVLDSIAQLLADHFFQKPVGECVYRETYGSTDTDNWDNGVYIIDDALDIVGRKYNRHDEELDDEKTQAIYALIISHAAQEA